jgi:phospholipid transport system substrate-binding protein
MMHRRTLLLLTGASALALALPLPLRRAFAQGSPERATAFVKQLSDRMLTVVNGSMPEAEKRRALQQLIDESVDVDGVGRFCLGRFWLTATPDQQKNYLSLFHEVLTTSITSKIGEYQGVRVTIGRATSREDSDVVASTVERPNNPPATVQWIVGYGSGAPKIIDVIAEGTSLRLTQRSDYASFMSHNGNSVPALINAMKQQVAQNN